MKASEAIALLTKEVIALKERVTALEARDGMDEEIGEIPGLGASAAVKSDPVGSPGQTSDGGGSTAPKARIEDPPGSGQWNYAPPTPAQAELRERMLPLVALENLPADTWNISKEDAEAAFLKAGPLWLYDADHDYVMGLPVGTRQAFVQDVNLVDPPEAELLARDLLKVWDEDAMLAPEDIIERDAQWRARGGSAVAGAYRAS